MITKNIS